MIALALLALALLALLLALAGAVVPGWRGEAQWLLLVDRSDSMPRDATDRALAQAVQRLHDGGAARVRSIDFAGRPASGVGRDAGRPRLPPDPADPRVAAPGDGDLGTIEPSATDIESAVDAALALHARQPLAGLVVVSDGFATRGDTQRALRAAAAAGVSVSWIEVGRPPPALHLDELLVPDRAVAGAPVALGLRWQGQHAPPMRVRATARQADGEVLRAEADVPAGAASATLVLAPRVPGPVVVDLEAVDAGSGRTLDAWPSAGLIEVATPAPVLLLRGGDGPLAASLRAGGWPVDVVPAARAAAYRDALASYRAIVLDDVAIADAPAGFWDALAEAVRDHGAGLLVLAGERSLAAGGLLGSTLESLLPVRAEPPALDDTTFVVFAVDKSGSMGLGRAGVDRFRLAQRAVVETAGALHAGDGAALLVFDAGARVLLPPTPAPQAATALARDWPATPAAAHGSRLRCGRRPNCSSRQHPRAGCWSSSATVAPTMCHHRAFSRGWRASASRRSGSRSGRTPTWRRSSACWSPAAPASCAWPRPPSCRRRCAAGSSAGARASSAAASRCASARRCLSSRALWPTGRRCRPTRRCARARGRGSPWRANEATR